jgi:hypothetical protein
MQPSEFWRLPICDFWAELDSKIEEGRKLKEMTEGIGKGKPGNVFTGAEWEAARRKHAEKMKAKK